MSMILSRSSNLSAANVNPALLKKILKNSPVKEALAKYFLKTKLNNNLHFIMKNNWAILRFQNLTELNILSLCGKGKRGIYVI